MYDSNIAPTGEMALDPLMAHRNPQAYSPLNGFPAFFEQVMLPGLEADDATHGLQQPRVFDFMQDTDFTFSDTDIFGTDFIPDLDKVLDVPMAFSGFEDSQQPPLDDQKSASQRAAAFGRSLWWVYSPSFSRLGLFSQTKQALDPGEKSTCL